MHKRKSLETFQGFTFPVTRPDNNSQIQEGKKWIKYDFKVFHHWNSCFYVSSFRIRWYKETNFPPYKNLMGTHIVRCGETGGLQGHNK